MDGNRLAVDVGVLIEMIGEFFLLRVGQRAFFAGVTQSQEFVFAAANVFFVPSANGGFIDEEGFGNLRNGPTGAEEDDGFDAIRFFAITLEFVKRLERSDLR